MKLSLEQRLKLLYYLKIISMAATALFLSIAAFEYFAVGSGINWPLLGYALASAFMYFCIRSQEQFHQS
ncbi:MAG: hypothetical protein UW23_C0001G0015 [Candidatus Collierbacteria bacterium GW2011_GWA1_44_12]|uniref:Uncharacterized protein n=1 Tax=Candidatus Collierbacteria bacterium GW2011_GWA1_44_12 TaxID=1618376 RepID=A0A0G1GPE4_9BACT|nr:MAG: hypothetical protein UW23_C0001G0015 [Candidatus Collierbacteria bacterium GW2011_GWA1_44_12]